MKYIFTDENIRLKEFSKLIDSKEFERFLEENYLSCRYFDYGSLNMDLNEVKAHIKDFLEENGFTFGVDMENKSYTSDRKFTIYIKDIKSGEHIGALKIRMEYNNDLKIHASDINDFNVSDTYMVSTNSVQRYPFERKHLDWRKYNFKEETSSVSADNRIKISDNLSLYELKLHEKGDMKGYITGMVETDGYGLEMLFRIKDAENGLPMTLISIDYGYRHPDVSKCWEEIISALNNYAENYIKEYEPEFYYNGVIVPANVSVKEIVKDNDAFRIVLNLNEKMRDTFGIPMSYEKPDCEVYAVYTEENDAYGNFIRDHIHIECCFDKGYDDEKTVKYFPKAFEENSVYIATNEFCYEKYNKSFSMIRQELNDKTYKTISLEEKIDIAAEKANNQSKDNSEEKVHSEPLKI